ncbi:hypothetical protein [Achromobacter spanius]|uniref:hypothetical protein n=1 Tax=Achromobacter spanius TaxID=217203 RepID=UPI003819F070
MNESHKSGADTTTPPLPRRATLDVHQALRAALEANSIDLGASRIDAIATAMVSNLRASAARPKRGPVDDWRVQAIAECLETEWDEMSPGMAEANARIIVGYLIEYEKESELIEANQASTPLATPLAASEGLTQKVWAAAQTPPRDPVELSVPCVASPSLLAGFHAPVVDIRGELNGLGMMAHTALSQDASDRYNILDHLAERLLALAGGEALAIAPVAKKATPVAWRYRNEKSEAWYITTSDIVAKAMHSIGRPVEALYAAHPGGEVAHQLLATMCAPPGAHKQGGNDE